MYILLVIALIPILIHITGNNHVYKTVRLTIGMGSLSPSLFEYKYFPGALIESGTPQPWPVSREYNAVGLTPEEASFHEEYRSLAFVLIRKDSILFESYWDAEDTTWSNSFSMAKSFIAMALGAAIQDGLIQGIDELVGNYLPEFAEAPNDVLSIRHLLSMSSGIPYPESYINPFGFVAKLNYGTDIRSLVLSKSVEEEPGKYFHYSGGLETSREKKPFMPAGSMDSMWFAFLKKTSFWCVWAGGGLAIALQVTPWIFMNSLNQL
jgi:hypothetical protein